MTSSPASQAAAVRATRLLLGAYLFLTLVLFMPAGLRMIGAEALPRGVQSWVGVGALAGMIVTLVAWFLRISALGLWSAATGPRFALLPALFEGRFVSVGGDEPARVSRGSAAPPSSSPLGLLATDVARVTGELEARGQGALAELVRAALREAEGVTSSLVVYERGASADALARARAAVGAFEQHVVGLDRAGAAVGPEWSETFAGDLGELRAASDGLRARAP